jgi:hypothetical protein
MKVEIEKENAPPLEADSALLVGREDRRTGLGVDALKRAMLDKLVYVQARFPQWRRGVTASMALAQAVRDRLLQRWVQTARTYRDRGSRTVCYLSAEFLIGPQLGNNLINLGIFDHRPASLERARARSGNAARSGGGAGPGQRRPRAPGGMLPRFAGNARDSCHRLWHSATSSASSRRRFAMGNRSS